MRALSVLAIVSTAYCADPQQIFQAAVRNYDHDHLAALHYSYTETDNDSKGKSVSQITVIDGTPYERVVSLNGRPLTGQAEKREEDKYRRALGDRANETSAQRQKRIDKYKSDVKIFQEAPKAFLAKLLPDDSVGGRSAWVLDLTPDPNYHPANMRVKVLTGIKARVWVDKQDLRIAKADATVIDTVSLGWIMARINKGGHLQMVQTRLSDGTWMPHEFIVNGGARILLVDSKRLDQTVTFDGFQRIGKPEADQVSKSR
jgi:hypothetical protein